MSEVKIGDMTIAERQRVRDAVAVSHDGSSTAAECAMDVFARHIADALDIIAAKHYGPGRCDGFLEGGSACERRHGHAGECS